MKIQPNRRIRGDAQSHKYESVPEILIKVGLHLPIDVQMRDLEWGEPGSPRSRSYSQWADAAKEQLAASAKLQNRAPAFDELRGALSGGAQ